MWFLGGRHPQSAIAGQQHDRFRESQLRLLPENFQLRLLRRREMNALLVSGGNDADFRGREQAFDDRWVERETKVIEFLFARDPLRAPRLEATVFLELFQPCR